MATPAYGAAQPLEDDYHGAMQKVFNVLQMLHILPQQPPPKPVAADPYMLKNDPDIARANASFRNAPKQNAAQSLGRVTPKGQ